MPRLRRRVAGLARSSNKVSEEAREPYLDAPPAGGGRRENGGDDGSAPRRRKAGTRASRGKTGDGTRLLAPFPANQDSPHAVRGRTARRQLPRAPLWIAAVLSLAWIGLNIALNGVVLSNGRVVASGGVVDLGVMATTTLMPVILFFVVAILVRRDHDVRRAADAINAAAGRLAQPETAAADTIASVSQAVRREVNVLGDELKLAASQASDLETMLRSELAAFERSHSESARNLRALIDDLARQRETVVVDTDRVRTAIATAHKGLLEELRTASAELTAHLREAGKEATGTIASAGEDFDAVVEERTGAYVDLVTQRTRDLSSHITESAGSLSALLDEAAAGFVENARSGLENASQSHVDRIEAANTAWEKDTKARLEVVATQINTIENMMRAMLLEISKTLDTASGKVRARFGEAVTTQIEVLEARIREAGETLGSLPATRESATDAKTTRTAADATSRTTKRETQDERSQGTQSTMADIDELTAALGNLQALADRTRQALEQKSAQGAKSAAVVSFKEARKAETPDSGTASGATSEKGL